MEEVIDQLVLDCFTPNMLKLLDSKFELPTNLEQHPENPPIQLPPTEDSDTKRFGVVTQQEIQDAIEKRVPANTRRSTVWGYNVWLEWCKAREIVEEITSMDEKKINELMARFVQEVRRKDGKEYPPSSLTSIVSAVQRYLRENGCPAVSFFDETNPTYDLLRKSLDSKLKALTRKGVGCQRKQAQPITPQMEEELW